MVFHLFPLTTGNFNGITFKADSMGEAEAMALKKGYNIYDDYGLTTKVSKERISDKQLHYLQRNE